MDEAAARGPLERLHALGVGVAIDDFGEGFSSLSRLREMPVEQIKIDRSFMRDVPRSASASAVVTAIIRLAQALGREVVAEGVETEEQRAFLCRAGLPDGPGLPPGAPAAGGRGHGAPAARSLEQVLEPDHRRLRRARPTFRTASSTPGMKLSREVESWRIESVSPTPPKRTSWCATSPGRRTEWIGSCTLAPAARISSAVRLAVPDGASSLPSWCSSMISLSGMCSAAWRANCIISTAPIAKFGATNRLALPTPRSSSNEAPVVPITQCTPASRQARAFSSAASGWLKSTTTSASPSTSASETPSCGIGAARPATCRSAPSTAEHTVCPMRPAAPETATLITPRVRRSPSPAPSGRCPRPHRRPPPRATRAATAREPGPSRRRA